ncbi:hypothetical protein [Natrinema salaciae]|uniref:Uncharacterized protein n=1 Tax=Natrinema salaciae TaxID=1186196 RepID=A0A1H9JAQ8_9EURY|nr:hypothetical protein [Natrinema salaciae]SEQ83902.1 hypothetical protein SAMN04489841_2489 [Natrinema salaciae]
MAENTATSVAKYGPGTWILLTILLLFAVVGLAQTELLSRSAPLVLLPIGMIPLGLLLLYQGTYILLHPQLAIEEEIKPPSKYDLSYETERGAKKTAVFSVLGGFFALAIGTVMGAALI